MVVSLDDVLQINKEYRFTFSIKKNISYSVHTTPSSSTLKVQRLECQIILKKEKNIICWGMNRICLVYA
jgi:hypothetical protein